MDYRVACTAIETLLERYNRSDQPGLVVAVAHHGHLLCRRGMGLASVQHGVANTPSTRMRIGSTTKHFTCLAALLLQEDGLLDVDAPAHVILPELRALGDAVTLRLLMNHSAGWRCVMELFGMANPGVPIPAGWHLRAAARQGGCNFEPGQGQMYSNSGYHLLSLAIERAAGQPFAKVLHDRIFVPLDMTETECVPSDKHVVPRLAALHLPDGAGGWRVGQFLADELLGEGSMVSTLDDMLRWLAHLNGSKRVGSHDTWRQMLTPQQLGSGRPSSYALGLFRHDYRGVELIHHAGTVIGGNSQMLTAPAHGLDIVVMNNGLPISVQQLVRDLLDALLADVMTKPADALAEATAYAGLVGTRWHAPSGVLVTFGEVGGKLALGLFHSPPLPVLRERAGGIVSANFEDIALGPIEFRADELRAAADGSAGTLSFFETGIQHVLNRLPASVQPLPHVARIFSGSYLCADLAAEAEITFDGDQLRLSLRGEAAGWQRYQLQALSDTAFVITDEKAGQAGVALTAHREADGSVLSFQIDGLRARGLEFTRKSLA